MRYVKLLSVVACLATFGLFVQGQVPENVAYDRYDIGRLEAQVPEGKADILVVYSAKWCGPCQASRPQWVLLRSQGYKVVYIDIDDPYDHVGQQEYATTEIVDKAMETPPRVVPTLRFYNSDTKEFLDKKLTGMQSLNKIKETLWKPSSSTVLPLVPQR